MLDWPEVVWLKEATLTWMRNAKFYENNNNNNEPIILSCWFVYMSLA